MRGRPREKIWVVRPKDGDVVADIVRRAGESAAAIHEGRVFVGKKRVTRADEAVRVGDTVRIGPARATGPSTPAPAIDILFQGKGLVACMKPAGLPTVPDLAGASHSLVALVANAIGEKAGNIRVTSRLDRDVSGVVVFALDAATEERLRRARAEGRYRRRYIALASLTAGTMGDEGVWDAPIGRAEGDARLRRARGPEAKVAVTRWRRVATASGRANVSTSSRAPLETKDVALLAVDPVTGRTHQIRIHASDAGAPLVGDRDYGGATRIVLEDGRILAPTRIALHAARVAVPGHDGELELRAPVPDELVAIWSSLGGAPDAWIEAIASETPRSSTPLRDDDL